MAKVEATYSIILPQDAVKRLDAAIEARDGMQACAESIRGLASQVQAVNDRLVVLDGLVAAVAGMTAQLSKLDAILSKVEANADFARQTRDAFESQYAPTAQPTEEIDGAPTDLVENVGETEAI